MTSPIVDSSLVCAVKHQVSCDLGGEAVILNLESGVYYGLSEVGARIWSLIEDPCSVDQILQVLVNEYDIDAKTCESQIHALFRDLAANGLIETR
jgi:Coenzyme PQQ synthesis protein D (PqqD)